MVTETGTQEHIKKEEAEILEARKDPASFKPLYERYFKSIFVFVHHRVGEKELCADITSQVFLKALLNIGKYQFRGLPFSAWLYRIAINECNEFFRTSKRYRVIGIEAPGVAKLYEEMIGDHDLESLAEKLPDILQQLSHEELHFIELRFFEQRPFKEVGAIMNISENYAKVKVYRALDKLRSIFLKTKG